MDIRRLTPDYAVSPQIEPEDLPEIKAAGFTTVICNRPDMEIPMELHAEVLKAATEAAGLSFVEIPLAHGQMTLDTLAQQAEAMAASSGPVLAYCASGTRSSIVWCLCKAGEMSTSDIITAAGEAGYDLRHLAPQVEALAGR